MKLFWSLVLLIAVSILTAWYLTNYVYISDEERVLRAIERGRLAVESGTVTAISGLLAPDYSHAGGLDRSMVTRALYQFFNDTEDRTIQIVNSDIQINNDIANATIRFYFDAVFKSPNPMFEQLSQNAQNDLYEINVQFIKNNSDWKVLKTSQVQ